MAALFSGLILYDTSEYSLFVQEFLNVPYIMLSNHSFGRSMLYNGKIGSSASEEVTLSLIKSKCIPCLLHGLDACPINKTDGNSLDFTVRRTLCKVFHTASQSIILDCQLYFNFQDITVSLQQRKCKFLKKFAASSNIVCHSLRSFAQCELLLYLV